MYSTNLFSKEAFALLVTLNEVLPQAQAGKYAVGLFNTVNLEMAKGVLRAAEETQSPVIIGTAEVLLPYASLEELSAFLVPMAQKATVPVVLHFDHGLTEEKIKEAIHLGFTSVMYDCSAVDYEENIRRVAELTQMAHGVHVTVEAELGHVGTNEGGSAEGGSSGDEGMYTDPRQAREYVERTGVDALAVAIGTAHGAYAHTPKLDLRRLGEIRAQLDTPLVLHGGSGLSVKDFQCCIEGGISKVNIFTDINTAAAKAAEENWSVGVGMTDLMGPIEQAVCEETKRKMGIFGCCGKGR